MGLGGHFVVFFTGRELAFCSSKHFWHSGRFRGYDGTFVGVMNRHSLGNFSEFQWPFFSL